MAQYGPEAREEMEPAASAAAKEAMVEVTPVRHPARVACRPASPPPPHPRAPLPVLETAGARQGQHEGENDAGGTREAGNG
jgi:hypothetical protein